MPEWLNGAVSKTVGLRKGARGFESHPLRFIVTAGRVEAGGVEADAMNRKARRRRHAQPGLFHLRIAGGCAVAACLWPLPDCRGDQRDPRRQPHLGAACACGQRRCRDALPGMVVGLVSDVQDGRRDSSVERPRALHGAPSLLPPADRGRAFWPRDRDRVSALLSSLIVPGLILLTIWSVIAPSDRGRAASPFSTRLRRSRAPVSRLRLAGLRCDRDRLHHRRCRPGHPRCDRQRDLGQPRGPDPLQRDQLDRHGAGRRSRRCRHLLQPAGDRGGGSAPRPPAAPPPPPPAEPGAPA